ncbi:PD40 domain-containing protein [Candidatus Babeliales bacterium]|nr:PD40 domain-containing protein [Candidatus Babeliales bacterium]
MKYLVQKFSIMFLFSSLLFADTSDSDLQIMVQSKKTQKVPVGLVTVGHMDAQLQHIIDRLQKDLTWSGQCKIVSIQIVALNYVNDLQKIFIENNQSDVGVALFLSKKDQHVTWRLYDIDNNHMIAGHQELIGDCTLTHLAHTIADKVWPYLFGQSSCFRSKIAYCKQIWRKKHGREKPYKQIWIADFDGSNQVLFVDAPTVSFAPRWNNDTEFPLLFYSENTMSNVQLVLSNMFGKRKVICCFDGLNMQPTFSQDGKKVVFCLSKDGTSQLYLSYVDKNHKRIFDRLTFNDGRNIAPCFIGNDRVVFVSDYETHKPQIYSMDLLSKSIKRITDGGYCACPNYSAVRNQLVYSKMIGSQMQLFTYDLATSEHKQLTNTSGSKEEASWSICGNYIVFGHNQGHSARIGQLHLPTGSTRFLTPVDQHCTYPDCSPIYNQCLGILSH